MDPNIPAEILKWTLITLGGLLGLAAIIIGIVMAFRKPNKVKLDDNPAIKYEKAPKRFNFELCKTQHVHLEHRLEVLEHWRAEELVINAKRNQKLMFALGKIAQKLGVDIEPAD
jgi:hypothetical protein